jgi:hypothetical protein
MINLHKFLLTYFSFLRFISVKKNKIKFEILVKYFGG